MYEPILNIAMYSVLHVLSAAVLVCHWVDISQTLDTRHMTRPESVNTSVKS